MLIRIDGELAEGVTSKDIILHVCGVIGTSGGTGYTIEFDGDAIHNLSMEARMSISNMAIEAGARAGVIAPDEITFEYLKGRPMCPSGEEWDRAVEYWKSLVSDEDAVYDRTVIIDAKDIPPTVTWGTSPQDVCPVTGNVPMIAAEGHDAARQVRIRGIYAFATKCICGDSETHYYPYVTCRLPLSVLCSTLGSRKDKRLRAFQLKKSLSVLAPMVALKIFVLLPQLLWDARLRMVYMQWSFLDRVLSKSRQRTKDSTKFSSMLASIGENQAAPCVLR